MDGSFGLLRVGRRPPYGLLRVVKPQANALRGELGEAIICGNLKSAVEKSRPADSVCFVPFVVEVFHLD